MKTGIAAVFHLRVLTLSPGFVAAEEAAHSLEQLVVEMPRALQTRVARVSSSIRSTR